MGSLLGSISGGFAKLALLGSMFPVLIVFGLNLILVAPLLSFGAALQDRIKAVALGSESSSIVAFTFVVVVLTGLLYNLNTPIIRLYEGYPFQRSFIGRWMAARWKRRFRRARPLRRSLRFLGRELRQRTASHPELAKIGTAQTDLAHLLNDALPDREDLILPTRLGNMIRTFERYPFVAYQMDGIALWPRLIAKIDTAFAGTIDDAKTAFDFMLNCSFLSALTTCAIVILWLQDNAPLLTARSAQWGWRAALFAGLAMLFYTWAVGAAAQWGVQVRSAFDLYRADLLKALGYKQQPETVREERALWMKISRRLVFADAEELPEYENVPTRIIASPPDIQLTAARTLVSRHDGGFDITLRITNADVSRRTAEDVVVTETVPENYRLIVGSLTGTGTTIALQNVKPVTMKVDDLAGGSTVVVKYSIRLGSGS